MWQCCRHFTTRGRSPWGVETRVLILTRSLTSCVSERYFSACRAAVSCLVINVQVQLQHVPAPTSSPSLLCLFWYLLPTHHPTLSPPARASLRSYCLSLQFFVQAVLSAWNAFVPLADTSPLSQLKSISLKSALANPDRCKFSFLFASCTLSLRHCFIS